LGRLRRIRIASGYLRGRSLLVPGGTIVRPMRSRVREALFNHLGDRLRGARFLDFFAGSGAVGIEALSRGATEAVLVENGRRVLPVLRRNVENLDLGRTCRILVADIHREGIRALAGETPFDLIFLDPPFSDHGTASDPRGLIAELVGSPVLRSGGLIGQERPSRAVSPPDPPGSEIEFRRAYGDTTLELWSKIEPTAEPGSATP